jgi:hypothetical protein
MSNNPNGHQGHHTTTAERLATFRTSKSYVGHAHRGKQTGLGAHNTRTPIVAASPLRLADHEDCVRYPECLEAAAHRPGAVKVCSYPCVRYEHLELHADAAQRTNYPSMQQISEALG